MKLNSVRSRSIGRELLRGSQEKNSPIIESLRAAAISSFGPVEAGQIPLRLTMISDMVQNTPLANQFQAEPASSSCRNRQLGQHYNPS